MSFLKRVWANKHFYGHVKTLSYYVKNVKSSNNRNKLSTNLNFLVEKINVKLNDFFPHRVK